MAAKKKTKKSKKSPSPKKTTGKKKAPAKKAGKKKGAKKAKKKVKKVAGKKTTFATAGLTGNGATLTLVPRCSDLDGYAFTPTVADELAYWNEFKAIVEEYDTITVDDDPATWNESIYTHIKEVIAPKLPTGGALSYPADTPKYSRQTNAGWEDSYEGAANCSVYRNDTEKFSMGCEKA